MTQKMKSPKRSATSANGNIKIHETRAKTSSTTSAKVNFSSGNAQHTSPGQTQTTPLNIAFQAAKHVTKTGVSAVNALFDSAYPSRQQVTPTQPNIQLDSTDMAKTKASVMTSQKSADKTKSSETLKNVDVSMQLDTQQKTLETSSSKEGQTQEQDHENENNTQVTDASSTQVPDHRLLIHRIRKLYEKSKTEDDYTKEGSHGKKQTLNSGNNALLSSDEQVSTAQNGLKRKSGFVVESDPETEPEQEEILSHGKVKSNAQDGKSDGPNEVEKTQEEIVSENMYASIKNRRRSGRVEEQEEKDTEGEARKRKSRRSSANMKYWTPEEDVILTKVIKDHIPGESDLGKKAFQVFKGTRTLTAVQQRIVKIKRQMIAEANKEHGSAGSGGDDGEDGHDETSSDPEIADKRPHKKRMLEAITETDAPKLSQDTPDTPVKSIPWSKKDDQVLLKLVDKMRMNLDQIITSGYWPNITRKKLQQHYDEAIQRRQEMNLSSSIVTEPISSPLTRRLSRVVNSPSHRSVDLSSDIEWTKEHDDLLMYMYDVEGLSTEGILASGRLPPVKSRKVLVGRISSLKRRKARDEIEKILNDENDENQEINNEQEKEKEREKEKEKEKEQEKQKQKQVKVIPRKSIKPTPLTISSPPITPLATPSTIPVPVAQPMEIASSIPVPIAQPMETPSIIPVPVAQHTPKGTPSALSLPVAQHTPMELGTPSNFVTRVNNLPNKVTESSNQLNSNITPNANSNINRNSNCSNNFGVQLEFDMAEDIFAIYNDKKDFILDVFEVGLNKRGKLDINREQLDDFLRSALKFPVYVNYLHR